MYNLLIVFATDQSHHERFVKEKFHSHAQEERDQSSEETQTTIVGRVKRIGAYPKVTQLL